MAGKQAKILSDTNINDLLLLAQTTRRPVRNTVIVLLSTKAGLRACEIAQLTWDMITDPSGAVGATIQLPDHAAKKGSGRTVPLHDDLRQMLQKLRASQRSGLCPVTTSPGADKESNWLPAPTGKFILMLRMYWPNENDPWIIDGTWTIPAAKKVVAG